MSSACRDEKRPEDWNRFGRTIHKVCSSALIPLLIGIATVIISIVQLEIARQQRAHDFRIAIDQREQDLQIADNLQKDRVLADYIEQVSRLMITPNFTLADTLFGNVIRAKTLIAIRQLDSKGKAHLIKFLYETHMIRERQANVKLSDADLDQIDLSTRFNRYRIEGDQVNPLIDVAFKRLSLNYASFAYQTIKGGTFGESSLIGANFTGCRLSSVSFVRSILRNADFRHSSIGEGVDFKQADLTDAIIPEQILREAVSIEGAILPNGTRGVLPNMLADGGAEVSDCESNASMPSSWQIERLSGNVSLSVASYVSHSNLTSATNMTMSNNRCFYAAHGEEGQVEMRQIVPSMPNMPVIQGNVLLKCQLFCMPIKMENPKQTSIVLRIEQLSRSKKSLKNYTRRKER